MALENPSQNGLKLRRNAQKHRRKPLRCCQRGRNHVLSKALERALERKRLGIAVPEMKEGDGKSFADLAMWVLEQTSNPRRLAFNKTYVRGLLREINSQLQRRDVVLSSEAFSVFERKELRAARHLFSGPERWRFISGNRCQAWFGKAY